MFSTYKAKRFLLLSDICYQTRPNAHLGYSQHIKIGDAVLMSAFDPQPALLLVNQLPNILIDKFTLQRKGEQN